MLVLSRKKGEEIVIDRRICIKIVEIREEKVRIGITAPPEIVVNRAEVQDDIDHGRPQKPKRIKQPPPAE